MFTRRQFFLAEWFFVLSGLIIIGGYLAYSQYIDYLRIDAEEHTRLEQQSSIVEKNLVPQLVATNRALLNVIEDLPQWLGSTSGVAGLNRRLQVIRGTLPGVQALLVLNARGRVTASNDSGDIGTDLSQQDWFQLAARNNTPLSLYLAPPQTILDDAYAPALARSFTGIHGEFAGVVFASLANDFAKTLLESVLYTPDARGVFTHGDGTVFLVTPDRQDLVGVNQAIPGTLFFRHRESGQAVSVFTGRGVKSLSNRMAAVRTIQPAHLHLNTPLMVTISRDVQAVFAPWRAANLMAGTMYSVLVLATVLGATLYQRVRKRASLVAQKQATQLKDSEARQSAIFNASPDAMLITDMQGTIVQANQQVERLLHYTEGELLGKSVEDVVPHAQRSRHVALRTAFADSASTRRMGQGLAVRALRKDGTECDVEINLSRIHTEHGVFFVSALRDISARLLADMALTRSEQKFSTAFSASPVAASIATLNEGRYLEINRNFEHDFGWTAAELVGRTSVEAGVWADSESRAAWGQMIRQKRRVIDYEAVLVNRNGEKRFVSLSAEVTTILGEECILSYATDITARKRAEEKINTLAFFDQLTGLPNRTLLMDRLSQAMTLSDRNGCYAALLFIDLDHFKILNDTMGHDTGDQLLQQVAARLTGCVREGDTVARIGGDEFVVILATLSPGKQASASAIETVTEKILIQLNQVYQFGDTSHQCSASMGATLFRGPAAPVDDLMKQAELAMYRTKETGRNAMRFFDPEMETAVLKRITREKNLRVAVRDKEFFLHYQPQIVGDGQLTGAEALVRWLHPTLGMVSPAEFIPLAEETGLIVPLGLWVLETACAQLALWAQQPGRKHLTMAVNVSAHQFRQPDFVEQVLRVLKHSGALPHHLKLELTESLLVSNVDDTIEKMFALKAKGVGFSLDDFGTGYSSLAYLKRLPLDQLKIDQSFVRDVLVDPNDAAIAKTIVALAQSLGLSVIAEGVETQAQKDFLAGHGCHAYQGYFFSKPLSIDNFEAFALKG